MLAPVVAATAADKGNGALQAVALAVDNSPRNGQADWAASGGLNASPLADVLSRFGATVRHCTERDTMCVCLAAE
jgi:hypothetical protein